MASVTVDVDVDIDEFETDELVEEICRRLKRDIGRRALTLKQKEELKNSYEELAIALRITPKESIEVITLDDQMKYEHLFKIFHKYTTTQIETLLPE